MPYKKNPKMAGSGMLGCIPQKGRCPQNCDECFFQSGRSFLEPLDENLPNMPPPRENYWQIIRVNDGNDSYFLARKEIWEIIEKYDFRCFFNTSVPHTFDKYSKPFGDLLYAPFVLTVNPGAVTDESFAEVPNPPKHLMMVRVRVNTWNLDLVEKAVEYYSQREIPVILTFMNYFDTSDEIPKAHKHNYEFRKSTKNMYFCIKNEAWENIMFRFKKNLWVHSCGSEGIPGGYKCRHCGNCLREFYATMERLREGT